MSVNNLHAINCVLTKMDHMDVTAPVGMFYWRMAEAVKVQDTNIRYCILKKKALHHSLQF